MWEMTYICGKWQVFKKRLTYVGNDVDICEMAEICGTCLMYLTNGLNIWEMT